MIVERTFQGEKDYPKQDDFIDEFCQQRQKHYIITGGNRAGKTYCARACFGWFLREKAEDGQIFWCVGPTNEKTIERQQKDLWEVIPRYAFGGVSYNPRTGFGGFNPTVVLKFEDGRQVIVRFKTEAQWRNDPKAFEAEQVRGIWIDESVSEDAYSVLEPRTIDLSGWMLGSYIPDLAWVHRRFGDPKPTERVKYTKISMGDNPYLPPEEIAYAEENWSDEMKQVRLYGNPAYLGSLVYGGFEKEYSPRGNICKPFTIPAYWPRFRGMDWGTRSPTTCIWLAVSPNNTAYVYREYYAPMRTVPEHIEAINAMSEGETFRGPPVIDPSAFNISQANMTSIAEEFDRHGFPMMPAMRTGSQRAFEASVEKVKDWIRAKQNGVPMLQVFDDCKWLIKEFRTWSYKMDKFGNPDPNDRYESGNDHCLDALRYLLTTLNPTFGSYDIVVHDPA